MKKNLLFAAFMLSIGGTLAACGTSESSNGTASDEADNAAEETVVEETAEETAGDKTADEGTTNEEASDEEAEDVANDKATDEETSSEETTSDEENTSENAAEPTEAKGTLTQSDEQPYEINVLSGYELTSEEPGKDSLYLTEDSSVFMRIETFAPSELNFSQAEEQLKETLGAVNAEAEIAEGPALEGSEFINSSSYEVPSTEGKVTGIVFEKEDQLVRLTIFDSSNANATEDFIAMGKTIERTE